MSKLAPQPHPQTRTKQDIVKVGESASTSHAHTAAVINGKGCVESHPDNSDHH